jgi:hypothetical protein
VAFPSVAPGTEGGAALLVKVASSGCVRTRKDAECFRDAIRSGGYEKEDCLPLYRAVLALLGDMAALTTLMEPKRSVAMVAYRVMKKWYIADSECRCLRYPGGSVAVKLTTCPVHGAAPGAKPGLRNLDGLMR